MRKLIAAMNMTLDGYCDHTASVPGEDVFQHYIDLLREADTLLYGRTTYQLMESYWPAVAQDPKSGKADREFALLIDNIQKIVYSRTLKNVVWKNSILKKEIVPEEVRELKRQAGKNLVVGSPSSIVAFMKLGLVDELQLCVNPVILGKGLTLFRNITDRIVLKLLKTRTFAGGNVLFYYEPAQK